MGVSIAEEGGVRARRGRSIILDRILFYILLTMFGVLSLAWSLPAAAFFWMVPKARRPCVGQFGIMAGFRLFLRLVSLAGLMRLDLRALDALAADGPMVIVSNHRSLLDAVLLVSRLPRVVCIIKAGLWDNTFLGGGIRMAGYIRNDAPTKLIRDAVGALQSGQQLLIFPEGTRAASATLGRFKGGFALMAKAAGVPVQTVFLERNSAFLEKGWGVFRAPAFPLVYRASLGRRFDVPADLEPFVRLLELYFADALAPARAAEP